MCRLGRVGRERPSFTDLRTSCRSDTFLGCVCVCVCVCVCEGGGRDQSYQYRSVSTANSKDHNWIITMNEDHHRL